jgi:probable HAF family extracellular repeat protein
MKTQQSSIRFLIGILLVVFFGTLAVPAGLGAQDNPAQAKKPAQHHHYQLIDIGTFGGPASYINAPFNGVPGLNNRGMAVGDSATSTLIPPNGGCFFCGGSDGILPYVFHAFELHEGMVTDLGALPPEVSNSSIAQAINTNGDTIIGASENGVIDPLFPSLTEIRAVVWRRGQITDLGTLGGNQSAGFAINDRGQVAGFSTNTVPDPLSFLYFIFGSSNGTQTRAFLWDQQSGMRDLGTLGGNDAFAVFLNERGQVAGTSYTNSTPNPTTGLPTIDPFLWDGRTMLDLGTLGGTNGSATAVNNRGQVIGTSNLSGDQSSDPFLWNQGQLIDLYASTIGGNPLTANAISDAGEIVGAAAFPAQPHDAYLWTNGVATDLGHLNSDGCSEGWAMNSASLIVGVSFSCDFTTARAVLWENGSLVDLNTLIPAGSSLQLENAYAINDRGEIGGIGLPSGCSPQNDSVCGVAFVLIPCDEQHPGIEGCDYSLVEGSVTPAEPSRTLQSNLGSKQVAPQVRGPMNPIHGFRGPLGTWYRGFGGKRPTLTGTNSTPAETSERSLEVVLDDHEIEPSGDQRPTGYCEHYNSSPFGYQGYCMVSYSGQLNGYCVSSPSCQFRLTGSCPRGALVKHPGYKSCPLIREVEVDLARPCSF